LEEIDEIVFTPFEKNIEVWRQLWRVIERSDIVVQIVDARNPLLFRSIDLERYVHEIDGSKINLLLINKSDLLTVEQRSQWANYFRSNRITYRFWSAEWAWSDSCDSDDLEHSQDRHRRLQESELAESIRIVTRAELLDTFEQLRSSSGNEPSPRITVGMVGYPNVGKSSTINALYGEKKVAVAATPGKTKHFQTLIINDRLCLCDCPGLVFPTVTSTKAELVVNGILSIDQLRNYIEPVSLVCQRIPRPLLQLTYGIRLSLSSSSNPHNNFPSKHGTESEESNFSSLHWHTSLSSTPHELLTSIASMRGFMKAGHGTPDESRAARLILKDYVNGKLLYCHPPPHPSSSSSSKPSPTLDSVHFNAASYDRQFNVLQVKKHFPLSSSSSSHSMIEQQSTSSDLHQHQPIAFNPNRLNGNLDIDESSESRDGNSIQVHIKGQNYLRESTASTRGNFKIRPSSKKHFNQTKRQR
jgi:large subunit GTPase 1